MTGSKIKTDTVALTTRELFSQKKNDLKLTWWAGNKHSGKGFTRLSFASSKSGLAGYFDSTCPNQAQILGEAELKFFEEADTAVSENASSQLFQRKSAAIFISNGLKPPEKFREYSKKHDLPIICSSLSGNELIDQLRCFLVKKLAEKSILHGVLMEIIKIGVLIAGQSGLGKSELALDLVSRGHRLIADDAPEFARIAPDTINGTCPDLLQNFLEVRGLGILNIREMYGSKAVKSSQHLELIIKLLPPNLSALKSEDRSRLSEIKTDVLGVSIPTIALSVAPSRNLAVLVEAAVRDHLLIKHGYIASKDFSEHQKERMQ